MDFKLKRPTGGSRIAGGSKAAGGKPGKKPPKYEGKARVIYYAYIALTVLAALIVVGYVIFSFISAPPKVDPSQSSRPPQPNVTDAEGNPIEVVPNMERKEQYYTFLLVGQSQETGGSLTDTMMLASYDVPNQALNVMSLPRDTYVQLNGRNVLLNTVYTRSGSGERGIDVLRQTVRELTGVYPDYYVIIRWEAFGELVDAIGGVYYDVPRNMHYWDPTQNLLIDLDKGYQLLDGDKAMQVVRFREGVGGYVDGDLGRIRTQQDFLKALVKKCLDPGVLLTNLGDYIAIFQRNVTTNLDVSALTYFGKSAIGGLDMDNVEFVTMPYREAGDGAHLLPDGDKILEQINESFSPYQENIGSWELNLVTSIPIPSRAPTPSESPEPTESVDPDSETDPNEPQGSEEPDPGESPAPTESGEGPLIPDFPEATDPAGGEETPPAQSEAPVLTPPPMEPEPTPEVPGGEEAPYIPN